MAARPEASATLPDDIAADAALWAVRLDSEDPVERASAEAAFLVWLREDPRHAEAAQAMRGVIGRLALLRGDHEHNTRPVRAAVAAGLRARAPQRRAGSKTAGAVLAVLLLAGAGLWAWQGPSPRALMADLRTARGAWEPHRLADGSTVTLGSATALDVQMDAQSRELVLYAGSILVDVAHDPLRPFRVRTPHGSIRALGTRFVVEVGPEATELSMLSSRVRARPLQPEPGGGEAGTVVSAGERIRIGARHLGPREPIDPRSVGDAWTSRLLVVRDEPLSTVLDRLNHHRTVPIVFTRDALQAIHVAAVLPLDDTDRALELLAHSVPALRVRRPVPYLVLVDVKASP